MQAEHIQCSVTCFGLSTVVNTCESWPVFAVVQTTGTSFNKLISKFIRWTRNSLYTTNLKEGKKCFLGHVVISKGKPIY